MPYVYTGQFNGYVAKATGQLIAFARNPTKYKLNKYTQLVPTKDELGIYYLLHPDDFVRTLPPAASTWVDGAKRPEMTGQRVRHKTAEFQCIRYDYDFQIGWRTLQNADYKVLLANTNSAQNQCMLEWTQEVMTLAENAANWGSNTANAVDMLGGAMWDAGTPEDPVIKKTLGQIASKITLNTNGMAADYENPEDVGLMLVINPDAAIGMASIPEVHAIYKESLYADALVRKGSPSRNAVFQLPDYLYGFHVIVETAVEVTEKPEATGGLASTTSPVTGQSLPPRRYVKQKNSALICSRPGGIDGELGAPNYSTIQRYHCGPEMSLKIFDEAKHEYTDGHVNRFGVTKLAAPATGFFVTNILAA
jgi:hypothetical protein